MNQHSIINDHTISNVHTTINNVIDDNNPKTTESKRACLWGCHLKWKTGASQSFVAFEGFVWTEQSLVNPLLCCLSKHRMDEVALREQGLSCGIRSLGSAINNNTIWCSGNNILHCLASTLESIGSCKLDLFTVVRLIFNFHSQSHSLNYLPPSA